MRRIQLQIFSKGKEVAIPPTLYATYFTQNVSVLF